MLYIFRVEIRIVLCEFAVSLVYIVSFRSTRATWRDPISKPTSNTAVRTVYLINHSGFNLKYQGKKTRTVLAFLLASPSA